MRRLCMMLVAFVVLLLVGTIEPAYADGGFFRSQEHIDEELYETGQKAIIVYQDNVETLVLQVKYEGNVDDFAWVVPVPGYPIVNTAGVELFEDLAYLTAPMVSSKKSIGCGGVFGTSGGSRTLVDVWEEGDVGIYHYAVLSSNESSSLIDWLNDNGYAFPEDGDGVVEEYIDEGWYFVAAKIRANESGDSNEGVLQPLKLSFESDETIYPLKISSLSSAESKIILYVFSNSSMVKPLEYSHVALHSGEQVLHLSREDNIFYQEYFSGIEGGCQEGYCHYDDDYGRPLGIYGDVDYLDLLGKESYFLTKLTAVIEADHMVDITLVEYSSEDIQDSDGDGWSDEEEAIVGTNPNKPDTDGDGTDDIWDGAPLYNRDVRVTIIAACVILVFVLFCIVTRKRRFWRVIFSEIRKDWWKWILFLFFIGLLIALFLCSL